MTKKKIIQPVACSHRIGRETVRAQAKLESGPSASSFIRVRYRQYGGTADPDDLGVLAVEAAIERAVDQLVEYMQEELDALLALSVETRV